MDNIENAKSALRWIKTILVKSGIPYQVTGGLAAKIYGSSRPLADIDIEIPNERMSEIVAEVIGYIKSGPEQYRDDEFDILLMTLNYHGQDIDISGVEGKLFDKKRKEWFDIISDLSQSDQKEIWGMLIPVTPQDKLIEYKKKIAREVDIEDVRAIEKF